LASTDIKVKSKMSTLTFAEKIAQANNFIRNKKFTLILISRTQKKLITKMMSFKL